MIDGLLRMRMFPSRKNKRACMNRIMNVDEAKEVCQNKNDWRNLIKGNC